MKIDTITPLHNCMCRLPYKWVEVRPVKVVDSRTTIKFLKEVIFFVFDFPLILIYDNGTHFVNDKVKTLLRYHCMEHMLAIPKLPIGI